VLPLASDLSNGDRPDLPAVLRAAAGPTAVHVELESVLVGSTLNTGTGSSCGRRRADAVPVIVWFSASVNA